ncbi:transposase [Luteococcus sp. Sow4_B9]|uniref:transposase n=1 Tax=Luteococcus sp. Sow4_B9 TaxID=3438792 RepID=UPI003F99598D
MQVLLADPAAVVDVVEVATRLKVWRLGIGLGDVEGPLPDSTRAARGGAYLAARTALEEARHSPTGLRLMVHESVGRAVYGEDRPSCAGPARRAETALWLWQELLGRRTDEGWEIVDLLDEGRTVGQAADHLGITASAASQRHRRAGWEQSRRGRELCVELIVQLWEAGGHA